MDILSQSIIDVNKQPPKADEFIDIFSLKYAGEENMVLKDPFIKLTMSNPNLTSVVEEEVEKEDGKEDNETNKRTNEEDEEVDEQQTTEQLEMNRTPAAVVETLPMFCARPNTKIFNVEPTTFVKPNIHPIQQEGYHLTSRADQQLAEVTKMASAALNKHPFIPGSNINNSGDDSEVENRIYEKLGDFEANRNVIEEISARVRINDQLNAEEEDPEKTATVRESVRKHFENFFNRPRDSATDSKVPRTNGAAEKENIKRIVQQGIVGDPLNNIVESFMDNFIPLASLDTKQQNIYLIITTITTNVYSALFNSFDLKPEAKDLEIMTKITASLFYEIVGDKVDTMLNTSGNTSKRSVRIYLLSLMLIPYSVKIYTSSKRKTVVLDPATSAPQSYPPIMRQQGINPYTGQHPTMAASRKTIYTNFDSGDSRNLINNLDLSSIGHKRPNNVVYDFGSSSGPLFMNNTNVKRARLG